MNKPKIEKGNFVRVGNDIGVVVGLEGENDIPEEHTGVWCGQTTENNIPLYRTVPTEYCVLIKEYVQYH